jgi:hypothetical protein
MTEPVHTFSNDTVAFEIKSSSLSNEITYCTMLEKDGRYKWEPSVENYYFDEIEVYRWSNACVTPNGLVYTPYKIYPGDDEKYPYWNTSRLDQVIGRAIRYCSHKDLPAEDREVNVYLYLACGPKGKKAWTVDQHIYKIALEKEKLVKQFYSVLKTLLLMQNYLQMHKNLLQILKNLLTNIY